MPLQRRLPKRGFNSPTRGDTAEVRLSDLNPRLKADTIDILVLKGRASSIHALSAKVIVSGEINKDVHLLGIKGARAAVEAAGGKFDREEKSR